MKLAFQTKLLGVDAESFDADQSEDVLSDATDGRVFARFCRKIAVGVLSSSRYVLPRQIRREVYEPYYYEMLEDYLIARRWHVRDDRRMWVTFAFAFRAAVALLDCLRIVIAERLPHLLPQAFVRLLRQLSPWSAE